VVLSLYDPNLEWDGRRHRWSEVLGRDAAHVRGHEGLRGWSREYYAMWENLEDTLDELIDAGENDVVAIVTTRGKARGSGIEVVWKHHAGVWTVQDRKIVRVVWFPTREEALQAAGLSE
jgi:ketosteroid isomerase-like protein